MAETLRFGLVGAGAIAQSHAQGLRVAAGVQLVGVADTRLEAAQALAEEFSDCAAFASHQELVSSDIDAAIVCTPPATHDAIVTDLVGKKVHVLCEKPLCFDADNARSLVQAAESAGVVLTMASKFRYVEDVIRAKSAIASGILGNIILCENTFSSRVDMTQRWNSDPSVSGGGVLIDNGTHSVDIMRYILGPVAEVMALEGRRTQQTAVEDTARLFIRSHDGVMGSIDLSWSMHKEIDSYIDVYGSHGTLRVGWQESKYRQTSSPDWVVFGDGYNKVEALKRQIENFRGAILGTESLLIGGEDAVASVAVIQAAYESMRSNSWTDVSQTTASTGVEAA